MERKPSSKENSMHYLLQVAKDPGIKKYMYEFIGKESEWIRFLAVSFTSRKSIALFPIRIVLTFSSSFFCIHPSKALQLYKETFFRCSCSRSLNASQSQNRNWWRKSNEKPTHLKVLLFVFIWSLIKNKCNEGERMGFVFEFMRVRVLWEYLCVGVRFSVQAPHGIKIKHKPMNVKYLTWKLLVTRRMLACVPGICRARLRTKMEKKSTIIL